jgi:hypothetical protein
VLGETVYWYENKYRIGNRQKSGQLVNADAEIVVVWVDRNARADGHIEFLERDMVYKDWELKEKF